MLFLELSSFCRSSYCLDLMDKFGTGKMVFSVLGPRLMIHFFEFVGVFLLAPEFFDRDLVTWLFREKEGEAL